MKNDVHKWALTDWREYRDKCKTNTQVCVRHVPVGHKFLLIRSNEEFTMMEIKRKTPSGTQYVVHKNGEMVNRTLHHSCHVVLFGKSWTASAAT